MTVFVDRGGLELISSDPYYDAWEVELDRIELDVLRAERALETGCELRTDDWDVPRDHGPIPAELRAHAEDILERQRAVIARIAEQLGVNLRHQTVVERIGLSSSIANVPVYLDVSA